MGDLLTELLRTSRKWVTRAGRRSTEMRSRSLLSNTELVPMVTLLADLETPRGVLSPAGLD